MSEPSNLRELQGSIRDWSEVTFLHREKWLNGWNNPLYTFSHLTNYDKGEIYELRRAIYSCDTEKVAEEIADCMILLIDLANLTNVDIYDAINGKMAINRARKWGQPDESGIIHHVEQPQK